MPLQSKDEQLEKSTFVYEVKQNDFTEYFRNDDLTLTDLTKEYANSDKPFVDLQTLGEKITEAGFAEIEQNGNCTAVTVDIDKNDLTVAHYDKDYENGEHTFRHSSLSAAVSDIMNDTQAVGHIVSDTEIDNQCEPYMIAKNLGILIDYAFEARGCDYCNDDNEL